MSPTLDQWQERLAEHFTRLAATRRISGFPIFALEHGLQVKDVKEIEPLLIEKLHAGTPPSKFWLVWVVYATELGYDYDGDEFWHTFEERTPHWRENASRGALRSWFAKFQTQFYGVSPSGPWAEWFSIIAWPITHAILPKYLQRQLALTLHELRYRLASLNDLTPLVVGRLVATYAQEASSRFKIFLQQDELVGRIALALLADSPPDGLGPISTPTLERIVTDLELVRSSRERLRETRRVVADRFHGAGRATILRRSGIERTEPDGNDGSPAADSPNIRPRLLVHRTGVNSWVVVVELSGFSAIAALNPTLRSFLAETRCRISGASETWLAPGWILGASRKRQLKSWPGFGDPILAFERPNDFVAHLLVSECRLNSGPLWLFRIGPDGIGREIAGRIVRPGWSWGYVVLSEAPLTPDDPLLLSSGVECDGVCAYHLGIPDEVSVEECARLQKLGLTVARTIRIWPAGLLSRQWDGEGHSEWLTTETPSFGIVHDHPVETYSISVDSGPEKVIKAGVPGNPIFVRLPRLLPGRHVFAIRVKRNEASLTTIQSPKSEGFVLMDVREPQPWVPGSTLHTGMTVTVDPHDPTLDDFLQERMSASVLGPEGHQVTSSIVLRDARGSELLSGQIGSFELPVTAGAWLQKVREFLTHRSNDLSRLDPTTGKIVIRGEELGEFALRVEREVKPIRWIYWRTHDVSHLRLIDETGNEIEPSVEFFSFARPPISERVLTAEAIAGFSIPGTAGLYVARLNEHRDIITLIPKSSIGPQDLNSRPDMTALESPGFDVNSILSLLDLWTSGRPVGSMFYFAEVYRGRVLQQFRLALFAKLCGAKWRDAEQAFLRNPNVQTAADNLARSVDRIHGFASALRKGLENVQLGTLQSTQWFAETAKRYGICADPKIALFALAAAIQPERLRSTFGDELDALLSQVTNQPILRGARLVVLLALAKSGGAAN